MKNFILIAVALFCGCGFHYDKTPRVSGGAAQTTPVGFNQVWERVLVPKCLSCHSGAGGDQGSLNLETYPSVLKNLGRIETRALEQRTMPPAGPSPLGPLSTEEAQVLVAWIAQGAPREASAGTTTPLDPVLKTGPYTWELVRTQIIERRCLECHSQPNPEAKLDLGNVDEVRAKAALIFDRTVVRADMPALPLPRLLDDERRALSEWILQGMK
ncbi:MAG: hypothetical protein AB7P04_03125 [Bacteriovoracia bacterium]